MKRLLLTLLLIITTAVSSSSAPRIYGFKALATTTNQVVTFPWHPTSICVKNDGATNGIYYDWSDGVATSTNNSTNHYLSPGETNCYTFALSTSPFSDFTVGVIAAAATSDFHINAARHN